MTSSQSHSGEPACDGVALKQLLERQLEIYRKLEELGSQQTRCLEEGWSQQLLAVLDARQQLIVELTALCRETQRFRQTWPQCLASLPAQNRAELESLARSVHQMHQHILEQDRRNLGYLHRLQEQTRQELAEAHRAGQAMQGYRQPVPAANHQMDQEA